MKKLTNFTLLLFAVACLFALTSCSAENELDEITLSGTESADAKMQMRPFGGSYETRHYVLPESAFPIQRIRITGQGQFSHMGKSIVVTNTTLNLTPPPPFITNGTNVITAANGDELHSSFTGTAVPQQDGRLLVTVNHTITGGTGRFYDASGHYTGVSYSVPAAEAGLVIITGEIAY
ncbi:hypothetical protein GCM10023188_30940 [Pontibacter saemangeumensis]|uniref:Lipoprotein n=1 Tax=Pontibacter saemangeumensis TaxID=1084525 RepID=A0ABP8LUB6_9BACT